mmetsp:Transcript_11552/g.40404  ORF Transcript_11552/g.40404 Transcript_11552/m.40404 type:complete len:481 (-) Transcript_11552:72-1514(-)
MDVFGFGQDVDPSQWDLHLYSSSDEDEAKNDAEHARHLTLIERGLAKIKQASAQGKRTWREKGQRVEDGVLRLKHTAEEKQHLVRGLVRKALTGNKDRRVRDMVKEEMKTPMAVTLVDKVAFLLGVLGMLITEFMLVSRPQDFWMWYTATMLPLLVIRYLLYHSRKWHYFMLDFCYAANVLCLVFLFAMPDNPHVFQIAFASANGPLAWAILAWRNSLVFHSLDKLTSLWIHWQPCLLTYAIRWHSDSARQTVCALDDCSFSWADTLAMPIAFYAAWQLLYSYKTDIHDAKKLKDDPSIQTSSRWFLRARSGALYVFAVGMCRRIGTLKRDEHPDPDSWSGKFIFMFSQLVYTVVTLLPCKLFFESQRAHTIFLLLILVVAVWNGGVYYIEVFSKRYVETLKKLRDEMSQRDKAARAAVKELAEAVGVDSASEASGSPRASFDEAADADDVPTIPEDLVAQAAGRAAAEDVDDRDGGKSD